MPSLITALTISASKMTTRNKTNRTRITKKKSMAKTQYLNVKAPIKQRENAFRLNLNYIFFFILTIQQMGLFLKDTRLQVEKTIRRNLKIYQLFFEPNNCKRLKIH